MARETAEPVVFLHGAGELPDAWDGVRSRLERESLAPDYVDVDFTFAGSVHNVIAALDAQGFTRVHLVGLSLGAMTAVQIAAHYPERIASLTLSAGQVRPPRAYMAVFNALFRIMPASWLRPRTATKRNMTAVFHEIGRLDLRADLARITAPTLVLCGRWDLPSRWASRQCARRIRGAQYAVVPGAFHAWHHAMPTEFARRVTAFIG